MYIYNIYNVYIYSIQLLYIYTYAYTYVHIYIIIYRYMHNYVSIHTYIYINICICSHKTHSCFPGLTARQPAGLAGLTRRRWVSNQAEIDL